MKENEIGIALLQEIWLKKDEYFRISNYRMESKRRNEGYGGVAVLVREDIHYERVELGCFLPVEVVAVKIKKNFDPITCISVYVPPDRNLLQETKEKIKMLFEEIEDLPGEIVIGGDWNGHHETWDPAGKTCPKGALINTLIEASKFSLLNDGTHTCLTTREKRNTTVDLTLATTGVAIKANWTVDEQEFGSIHLAILIEIGSDIPIVKKTTKRINQEKAATLINEIKPQYLYDPEEMQNVFDESIGKATYVVKDKKGNWLKRWWTEEISEAYQVKRAALRSYNREKSQQNLIELQHKRAKLKSLIRRQKRRYCQEISEKVDEDTPSRQLWNIIRGLDTALTKPVGYKAEMTQEDGKRFMEHYYEGKHKIISMPKANTKPELSGYEMAIAEDEILKNLRKRKPHSAAGPDGMSYAILKKLRPDIQSKVCEMLNQVYITEQIPDKWRSTEVRAIPKPNSKDPSLPSAQRPICLQNVCIKLLTGAVKDRIVEITEIENLLPKNSFGFRKNCSATTCVNYLVNRIHEAQGKGQIAVAVFMDMSQAFDSVDTQILLNQLAKIGIPEKIIAWLHCYLKNRKMICNTTEGEIETTISEGLPQGCPLSPTLFNIYTAELHEVQEEGCELIQFADDFTVMVTGKTLEEIEERANSFLGKFDSKLQTLQLKLNPSKSAAVPFTLKHVDKMTVKISGEKIAINNTHKQLGIILDRTLTFRKHIEENRRKGTEKLKIIKILSRRKTKANSETLVKIGNAVIRSKLEYGAQVFGGAANTNIKKLQTVQNAYLRSAMGYLKTTPIHVIQAETGQLPIDCRIELLTLRDAIKSSFHRNQIKPFIETASRTQEGNGSFLTHIAMKHTDVIHQIHPKDENMPFLIRKQYSDRYVSYRIEPKLVKDQQKKTNWSADKWKQHFLELKERKYKNYSELYTDASKTREGTALAVIDNTGEACKKNKISSNYSITNAELLAIDRAIKSIKEKGYGKAVIFTDSNSACQMLLNRSTIQENFIAWNIIKELQEKSPFIKIQWIPSHQGIEGNERADRTAVAATQETQSDFTSLALSDALALAKEEIWDSWKTRYKETSEEKGIKHFEIMEEPGKTVWSKGLILTSEKKRILNRIRSGHTLTKERRYKWGWEEEEECDFCEEKEDLEHVLYMCPKFNIQRNEFPALEYCKPLKNILKNNEEMEMKQIVSFLKATKIQV